MTLFRGIGAPCLLLLVSCGGGSSGDAATGMASASATDGTSSPDGTSGPTASGPGTTGETTGASSGRPTGGATDSSPTSDGSTDGSTTSGGATGTGSTGAGGGSTGGTGGSGGTTGGVTITGGSTGTTGTTGSSTSTTGGVAMDACGYAADGPWVEIAYTQAGVPATSPSWTYSSTPGWGEAEWAAQGESWPEVWDVYDNIEVKNDPIGVLAEVDGSGQLQLMIGLQDLISYDNVTVCVEGRSVSATSSVIFDAYNPLNNCGDSTSMAHDWSVHAEGLDLGTCLVPGGGVQAIRIEPSGGSGSVGVMRMRVTLHGAVY